MAIFIVIWFVCAIVSAAIADGKGRNPFGGFFYGLIFGVLGVIITLLMKPSLEHQAQHELDLEEAKNRLRDE